MSTSREGPNPLRPYYRPPSIGIPQDTPGTTSSGTHGLGPKNGSAASYASSARDMFDYSDYLSDSSPSSVEAVKRTLDDWVYKYFSILLAQPFDVAKTVLQVQSQDVSVEGTVPVAEEQRARPSGYRDSVYSDVRMDNLMLLGWARGMSSNSACSTLQTTRIRTSLHTSPLQPQCPNRTLPPDHEDGAPAKGTMKGATLPHLSPRESPYLRTSFP